MELEISKEQFDQIQEEVIRLEEYLADNRDTMVSWEFIDISERIDELKKILKEEKVEI